MLAGVAAVHVERAALLLIGSLAHCWLFIVCGGVRVLIYILTVAVYRVAFRVDSAGITFGVNLLGLLGLKFMTCASPGQTSR